MAVRILWYHCPHCGELSFAGENVEGQVGILYCPTCGEVCGIGDILINESERYGKGDLS